VKVSSVWENWLVPGDVGVAGMPPATATSAARKMRVAPEWILSVWTVRSIFRARFERWSMTRARSSVPEFALPASGAAA
jgi:hypothetical protein